MVYSVSYLVEYKVVRKIEVIVEADSEDEALERIEFGEFDEVIANEKGEVVSDELIYKDLASMIAEEI